MQTCPLECGKIGFDQIQPRGIGGRPVDANTSPDSGGQFPQCLLMGTQVVHDKVDTTPGPEGKHVLQSERTAAFGRLRGESFSDRKAGLRAKRGKPLQGSIAFVTIWPKAATLAPGLPTSRDGLQGTHFVEADNLSPVRGMPIEVNYSVFFTSNSGSSLSHQVWPVRNRRP